VSRAALATAALVLVTLALWIANCSGPQPRVSDIRLQAPAGEGEPYAVQAVVENRGWGEGEVGITARLRDRASGRTLQQDESLHLQKGEVAQVLVLIAAPKADYTPELEAEYPPR
jgi:hypothetical protein